MELFELTKAMFGDTNNYSEATRGDKRKSFFMIQRRMAIQHPMQANALNQLKINQEEAVDVWQRFLSKKYKKTPFWMYTKGIKKAKEVTFPPLEIGSSGDDFGGPLGQREWYAFSRGDYQFIFLNSQQFYSAELREEQNLWLQEKLRGSPNHVRWIQEREGFPG